MPALLGSTSPSVTLTSSHSPTHCLKTCVSSRTTPAWSRVSMNHCIVFLQCHLLRAADSMAGTNLSNGMDSDLHPSTRESCSAINCMGGRDANQDLAQE